MSEWMTLAELADAAQLPARTIRFYIARGLLDGPVKAGRGAAYTPEHLTRLEQIRKLQADGRMLSDIARTLSGDTAESSAVAPTPWLQFAPSEDVVILTRADMSPWRMKQVRAAIDELAQNIRNEPSNGKRRHGWAAQQ
jgi:DNA-binding transcriptional MerR regulator